MVDDRRVNFRRECFAMLVVFSGGGPAISSGLSATGVGRLVQLPDGQLCYERNPGSEMRRLC